MFRYESAAGAVLSEGVEANEALSGVFGSISLTAWICLLVPQLYKNYKAKNADALSMAFLFVWLAGDAANLSGALFEQLAPTAVALGSYFVVADMVLISQCTYYNTRNARRARRHSAVAQAAGSEDSPLLGRRRSLTPGQRRDSTKSKAAEPVSQGDLNWWQNMLCLVAVYAVGIAAWLVSYSAGVWSSDPPVPDETADSETIAKLGQVLGYASAAFYLCARVPQIIKNWRQQSCEGLSMLFFMLSLTGNLMYGLSLVSYSQEREALVKAIPWLLGSFGTIVQDSIIFIQFQLYAPKNEAKDDGQV